MEKSIQLKTILPVLFSDNPVLYDILNIGYLLDIIHMLGRIHIHI